MKKAFFQLILAVLAVSSCGTAKYYGGFTPEASRQDMALLGPVSTIYYLDQNDEYFFSDSLTVASETLITGLVNGMNIPVSGRIELDEEQKDETAAFMRTLMAQKPKNRDMYAIPGLLDEVLEAEGYRYGLLLFAQGRTRDIKGSRKDLAKGVLVTVATAILTLGTAVAVVTPEKYSSQVMAAVLDSETDRIVFFNATTPQETDPLNPGPVHEQIAKILKDFLK